MEASTAVGLLTANPVNDCGVEITRGKFSTDWPNNGDTAAINRTIPKETRLTFLEDPHRHTRRVAVPYDGVVIV
jgi:hypothetical protein